MNNKIEFVNTEETPSNIKDYHLIKKKFLKKIIWLNFIQGIILGVVITLLIIR